MSTTEETVPTVPAEKRSFDALLSRLGGLRSASMLIALLIVVGFFQITTEGVMLKPLNVTNVFLQNGYILVMALGMLLVIVVGHIDLSVGSVAGFLGAVAAVLMVKIGIDPIIAVLLTLAAGGVIGLWQGFWTAYLRVPSFIVTLAGMLLFRGATLWLLGGQPVGPFPESFRAISSGFVPELFGTFPDPFGTGEPPIMLGPLAAPVGGGALQLTTLLLGMMVIYQPQ